MKTARSLVALALLCALPAYAAGPGVPLPAAEVNALGEDFGDGPTPMKPTPWPSPVPDGLTGAEYVTALGTGTTWFTQLPDGRWRFHQCTDPLRIETALAPGDARAAVLDTAGTWSTTFITLIGGVRDTFWAGLRPDMTPEEVNAAWAATLTAAAPATADAFALVAVPLQGGTCTEGRCDCCTTTACCPAGHTCTCKEYNATMMDCPRDIRVSCSVDDPPEPKRGARTVTAGLGR